MEQTVRSLLASCGITQVSPIPLKCCTVTKPYLLEKAGIADGTAFLFAVPYYTTKCDDSSRNISAYAVSADYHGFFRDLFSEVLPALQAEFPHSKFAGFSDHSPIAEGEAAVRAGLGMFGRNHLFLTEKHSSYVFLGEIITDAVLPVHPTPVSVCSGCGACERACPVSLDISRCMSALTQKKGVFSEEEKEKIIAHGCAWGCDICQEVCPVTKAARARGTLFSTIPFFNRTGIPHLTSDAVENMDEQTFASRAYSWRGRDVILRNLKLLEEKEPSL